METINCPDNCCSLKYIPYREVESPFIAVKRSHKKAGIFITDNEGRILLVQSKGNFWGCPKGTMKSTENSAECAIREVKEETGLDIPLEALKDYRRYDIHRNKSTYYGVTIPFQEVEVQNHIPENDANGIGWIKLDCLRKMVYDRRIMINQHCRLVIEKFLGIDIRPRRIDTPAGQIYELNSGSSPKSDGSNHNFGWNSMANSPLSSSPEW